MFIWACLKTHLSDEWVEAGGLTGNYRGRTSNETELCSSGRHVHGEVMCCIYTLWETLFPIIKTPTPTVKYGGHCLRYRHTLVGKNYLLLVYIMEDTAPDNAVRIRCVHGPRDRRWSDLWSFPIKLNELVLFQKGPIQCQFIKGKGKKKSVWFSFEDARFFLAQCRPSVNMHTSSSRCCFCQFDSITVIIMEVTAPDNYYFPHIKLILKKLFIVNPATDK